MKRPLRQLFFVPLALLATESKGPPMSPFDRVLEYKHESPSSKLAINGSGHLITQTQPLMSFDELTFRGFGHLHIKQGSKESITIEAEDTIVPHITSEVRGNHLILGFSKKNGKRLHNTKPINIYLTAKRLKGISINGSGHTTFDSSFTFDDLFLQANGSSTIDANLIGKTLQAVISGSSILNAKGKVTKTDLTLNGSSQFNGFDLLTQQTEVIINGSGKTFIYAKERLNCIINGSGSITHMGPARVTKKINGSGVIKSQS